jgi:hypothetical protein
MRIEAAVRELLLAGSATIVATRDRRLRPALTRGWGVQVSADGEQMTLCVGTPPGSAVRANLESNGEIAVTCSRPTSYRTVQVKGTAAIAGAPSADQLAAVEAQVAAFSAEVVQLGLPAQTGALLLDEDLMAVVVEPREVYDQTPGPGAGARL